MTGWGDAAGYSRKEYVLGVGMVDGSRQDRAQDMARADACARAEIAKQLRVKVQEVLSARTADGGKTVEASVSLHTEEEVDQTLEGVEIVNRHVDLLSGICTSLAVLPRGETASRMRSQASACAARGRGTYGEAKQRLASGDVAGAVSRLWSACAALDKAEADCRIANILQPDACDLQQLPDPRALLRDIQGRTQIVCTGGCSQQAVAGTPLPEPVLVSVTFDGAMPVAGLPVLASWPIAQGGGQQVAQTDARGTASFCLPSVEHTEEAVNFIRLEPAWYRGAVLEDVSVVSRSLGSSGAGPFCLAEFRLRTVAQTRVFVESHLAADGVGVAGPTVLAQVVGRLRQEGFLVVGTTECGDEPEVPRHACPAEADIVVTVRGEASYSSRRDRTLIYRSRIFFSARDTLAGNVLTSVTAEGLGAANDEGRAADRALCRAARDIVPGFVSCLRQGIR